QGRNFGLSDWFYGPEGLIALIISSYCFLVSKNSDTLLRISGQLRSSAIAEYAVRLRVFN
ncbi:hypothetical protein AB9P05_00005, partial [Roseivirga sp. BDSF3-8]|uniref:hypothetical protein n=1 Tax=Roseivirga sp. BDSF3-8 TaxID=3241598 RepID=UPI0035326033